MNCIRMLSIKTYSSGAQLIKTGVAWSYLAYWSQFEQQSSEYFVIYLYNFLMYSPIRSNNKKSLIETKAFTGMIYKLLILTDQFWLRVLWLRETKTKLLEKWKTYLVWPARIILWLSPVLLLILKRKYFLKGLVHDNAHVWVLTVADCF